MARSKRVVDENEWRCIEATLQRISREVYGEGKIAPEDGGFVFRRLSIRHRIPEEEICRFAERLGLWEGNLNEIGAYFEAKVYPPEDALDFAADPFLKMAS